MEAAERDRQRQVGRAEEHRRGELKASLDLSRALLAAGCDQPDRAGFTDCREAPRVLRTDWPDR